MLLHCIYLYCIVFTFLYYNMLAELSNLASVKLAVQVNELGLAMIELDVA